MQPSKPPPSAIEQRMAEYEESCILMIKLSMPPKDDEWTEALLKLHVDMKSRLVTLLESMMRRRTERELRDGPYQPPPINADRRARIKKAFEEGRLSEYYSPATKESGCFIDGEDVEAHHKWVADHPDAVLLTIGNQKRVVVTEDGEI